MAEVERETGASAMGVSGSRTADLTDEDVEFLKSRTNYQEETIREWYRGFKEDCPSGKVSEEKFAEMYKSLFDRGDPRRFCHHVFRTFDADGNGFVDFKEFLLAVAVTSGGSAEERLRWAFRVYDVDGDGFVRAEEMKKVLRSVYEMAGETPDGQTPEERTAAIFRKMDSDRDGKLSREEFVSACLRDPGLLRLLEVDSVGPGC
ncbi:neuronal calcium sensor 2-like isoform X1 [Centruroides sculpturatus]|uniref:neuronal calcium sensor 2-like isoform X1 n=2 Tax=Centruroides sculpturatus TaxID=218467 RepID=UPI000C6E8830|nr:neuronal calcium sensor 2-like isoform X1 [Centruroides sculpturatus]